MPMAVNMRAFGCHVLMLMMLIVDVLMFAVHLGMTVLKDQGVISRPGES
jgi:hypothetical protein